MFEPYDPATSSLRDRVAWALCEIFDDDAPLRWTRFRSAANMIANNPEVMNDLAALQREIVGEQELRALRRQVARLQAER